MSIIGTIGKLFERDTDKGPKFNWKEISTEEGFQDILEKSISRPQVIYKHSNRCATSYFARINLESISEEGREKANFYMVDVIRQRPLSLYVAEKLNINHESPQVLVLKNEKVIWHGSHQQVQADIILSEL